MSQAPHGETASSPPASNITASSSPAKRLVSKTPATPLEDACLARLLLLLNARYSEHWVSQWEGFVEISDTRLQLVTAMLATSVRMTKPFFSEDVGHAAIEAIFSIDAYRRRTPDTHRLIQRATRAMRLLRRLLIAGVKKRGEVKGEEVKGEAA